jgi:hypothetical protein
VTVRTTLSGTPRGICASILTSASRASSTPNSLRQKSATQRAFFSKTALELS